jgi:hypothetical protein
MPLKGLRRLCAARSRRLSRATLRCTFSVRNGEKTVRIVEKAEQPECIFRGTEGPFGRLCTDGPRTHVAVVVSTLRDIPPSLVQAPDTEAVYSFVQGGPRNTLKAFPLLAPSAQPRNGPSRLPVLLPPAYARVAGSADLRS